MADSSFYDCEPLLAMKDADGLTPAVYIVCSRVRGPGKTFSFTRKLMREYLERGSKFVLLCRTQKETGTIANGMFKSMLTFEYGERVSLVEKVRQGGVYSDVYLSTASEGADRPVLEHCGYVVALNASDAIKKISSNFSDADAIYFDEFMPEQLKTYLKNEVDMFHSVYKSIARGGGSSLRHVPVYMSSNTISIANPYFVQMGLTQKIQPETKKVRGQGVVFQRATNEGLIEEHANSAFEKAFGGLKAGRYDDNSWLNDNAAGVGKPENWGDSTYIGTLEVDDISYGFHLYDDVDYLYMSYSVDASHPHVYRLGVEGDLTHMRMQGSYLGRYVNRYTDYGTMKFQNQTCKMVAVQHLIK